MSCACMLIHCVSPLEKTSLNTPIMHLTKSKFSVRKRNAKLDGILFFCSSGSVQKNWLHTLLLISAGPSVSSSSLHVRLSFSSPPPFFLSFFLDCSHIPVGTADPTPATPRWSSNMQLGSRMIKAVAGGLHFETINRPLGAEWNSKPSISVSLGSRWHRGKGQAEGEWAKLHLWIIVIHQRFLTKKH